MKSYSFNTFKENFDKHFKVSTLFNQFLIYPVALILAFLFYKIKFSPNLITTISLSLGLIGAFLFYSNPIISGLLFFTATAVDYTDGAIARITKTSSKFGAVYDLTVDRTLQLVIWFVYIAFTNIDIYTYVAIIALLVMSSFISFISFMVNPLGGGKKKSGITLIRKIIYTVMAPGVIFTLLPILAYYNIETEYVYLIGAMAFARTLYMMYQMKNA